MQNLNKLIPILVIAILVVGAGSFYGGTKYAQSKTPTSPFPAGARQFDTAGANAMRFSGNVPAGAAQNRGGLVAGEVISSDDNGVTVKMRDGSSKIIIIGASTEITKSAAGAISDLVVGQSLTIMGDANADGSVTAKTVQIRPDLPVPTPANEIK
ncbi:MAG: hypothetical protein V1821_03460 [bacterium]